jgi:hypothetical protein
VTRPNGPGGRPRVGGTNRRLRADETLPGVQFPVVEDLTRIAADDEFLDAIAVGGADLRSVFAHAGGATTGSFPTFDASLGHRPIGLGPLLVTWRSELQERPLPPLPVLAARPMLAPADRSRRRSLRSLISVGAAICALLMASTAVGAHSAQPGQPLWGLSQVLWSEHANSVEARVNVEAAFSMAKKAIDAGNPAKARELLKGLDGEVDKVLPVDGRAALHENLKKLQQEAGGAAARSAGREPTARGCGSGRHRRPFHSSRRSGRRRRWRRRRPDPQPLAVGSRPADRAAGPRDDLVAGGAGTPG